MDNEHKTIALSIAGTLLAGVIVYIVVDYIDNGTINPDDFKVYVLPLLLSALTLVVFFGLMLGVKFMELRKAEKTPVKVPA